jgi:hypothetical protein
MRRLPADPLARAQRKQDLLLASGLARSQAIGALEEIGARADTVAGGAILVRAWVSDSQLWIAGGALGSMLALAALPRWPGLRLMRWATLGWRLWRIAVRMLAQPRRPA